MDQQERDVESIRFHQTNIIVLLVPFTTQSQLAFTQPTTFLGVAKCRHEPGFAQRLLVFVQRHTNHVRV